MSALTLIPGIIAASNKIIQENEIVILQESSMGNIDLGDAQKSKLLLLETVDYIQTLCAGGLVQEIHESLSAKWAQDIIQEADIASISELGDMASNVGEQVNQTVVQPVKDTVSQVVAQDPTTKELTTNEKLTLGAAGLGTAVVAASPLLVKRRSSHLGLPKGTPQRPVSPRQVVAPAPRQIGASASNPVSAETLKQM